MVKIKRKDIHKGRVSPDWIKCPKCGAKAGIRRMKDYLEYYIVECRGNSKHDFMCQIED